nr:reverse transcriptase family protein [Streptococcus dysgalactiae]
MVKKSNGSVSLCADFSTGLNATLDTHQYPLPVPEDLFAKPNDGKYFAKLNLIEANLQIEVDEDSKELLTINSHRGLFQYNRLPFGVKTAPAIFQQIMD